MGMISLAWKLEFHLGLLQYHSESKLKQLNLVFLGLMVERELESLEQLLQHLQKEGFFH